jgi:hypothetical protein
MAAAKVLFALLGTALACGARTELDTPRSTSTTLPDGAVSCPPEVCADEDIASGNVGGSAIAVDCDVVFWATDEGKIHRHDASGNHEIADGLYADSLALDSAYVYASAIAKEIIAISRTGGDTHDLGAGTGPLRVHDGRLYFVDAQQRSIQSMALGGSTPELVVGGFKTITDYDLDDANVVVAADDAVFHAKPGSSDAPVAIATTTGFAQVALYGSQVYVTDDGTVTLRTIPIAGGDATMCWGADDSPRAVVVDASGVYDFGGEFNASSIGWFNHIPLACTTGAPFGPELESQWVTSMTTSATAVYWTLIYQNENLPPPSSFVTVRKQCKPPG